MLSTRRITENYSFFERITFAAKQNTPPFTVAWVACLRSIVRMLGICAALCGAAVPASAQPDFAAGMARARTPPAWLQFQYSPWPFDLPPAGKREGDGGASRQPVAPSGKDQHADSPPYCMASCMVEMKTEPAPAQAAKRPIETTGAAPPRIPALQSIPVPARSSTVLAAPVVSASIPVGRASPFAGQTWLIAAAALLFSAIFAPGAVVLRFLALAGIIVGGASLLVDLTWQSQVIIFAVLGVALVMMWVGLDPTRSGGDDNAGPSVTIAAQALWWDVYFSLKSLSGGQGHADV